MALLELFIWRHQWMTSASGTPVNGGPYGLPDGDAAIVNSLVASAAQQLTQLQSQVGSNTDGYAYMNAQNSAFNPWNRN